MSDGPRRILGLTGLPSSGKGEAAAALAALAGERGWSVAHLSFSDEIKAEARRRGIADAQFERKLLSRIGTELRESEGPGVLAARIAERIRTWPPPCPDLFVVEALRHPGEVEALRRAYGDRFTLVGVTADLPIVARRLIARARPDEGREALRSEADALRVLERELHGDANRQAPNVGSTLPLADHCIENNGTLDDLRRNVRALLTALPG